MDQPGNDDDLVTRLEVIEAQPLASRAAAYESLHDVLSGRLDASPPAPPHTQPEAGARPS